MSHVGSAHLRACAQQSSHHAQQGGRRLTRQPLPLRCPLVFAHVTAAHDPRCSQLCRPPATSHALQAVSHPRRCRDVRQKVEPLLAAEHVSKTAADAARPVHTKAGDVSTDMLSSASEQSDKLEAHARPDGYGDTSDSGTGSDQSDSSTASVQLPMPRRSLQLQFTCGKCGATTKRMINPIAWEKGLVFAQCGGCEVWHNIRDAAGLIQEYRLTDLEDDDDSTSGSL